MDLSNSQHYTLRWKNYLGNLGGVMACLLQRELLTDVTLTAQGRSIKCHKVVLSACSPYFEQLFLDSDAQHPIIILKDVKFCELQHIVEYMYCGQISVEQQDIQYILQTAESLQVRGLVNLGDQQQSQSARRSSSESGAEDLRISSPPLPSNVKVEESPPTSSAAPSSFSAVPSSSSTTPPSFSANPPSAAAPPSSSFSHHDYTPPKRRRLTHTDNTVISSSLSPSSPHLPSSPLHLSSPFYLSSPTQSSPPPDPEDLRVPSATASHERRSEGSKVPTWTQSQLQEAIEAVITQKMRFTQASSKYGIPKGTLYDNILGKSKRMQVLDDLGLTESQELAVLEYCCEVSNMPYNRRTSKSLRDIIDHVTKIKVEAGHELFNFSMRQGFRWWWAFTKKHSIISLYYENQSSEDDKKPLKPNQTKPSRAKTPIGTCRPDNAVMNLSSTTPINYSPSFSLLAPLLAMSSPYPSSRC